jgi:hypothetical protein
MNMEMELETKLDSLIPQFFLYAYSHPNLSKCWIDFLALKKRNYADLDAPLPLDAICAQAANVLKQLEEGYPDLSKNDIVRLLVYKHVIQ